MRQLLSRDLLRCGIVLSFALSAACGGEAQQGEAEQAVETEPAGGEMMTEEGEEMQAAGDAELPEGVTMEMVTKGKEIFTGAGNCFACHGQEGMGLPNLGADLTDDEWLHIDGSFPSIVDNIVNGVSAEQSSSGTPMPPMGGSGITEEQARQAAAYVWYRSHVGPLPSN